MNTTLLLTRLTLATLVFTALAGLLTLARRPLRARIGAEAVYALWLLVPLGLALCCWPLRRQFVPMATAAMPAADAGLLPALPAASVAPHFADIVLLAWLLGLAASALLLVRRQRAFTRALGVLRPSGADTWTSARSDAGPMLVGLPRPRIVLPADFDARYTEQEQAAVLAHERMHRLRGDLWWNALCAALRCVFWFHPLGAVAQRAYLADQELACDSAVLRGRRHAPQAYANALLKTQAGAGLPLGCAMAASPLRERILNLGRRGSSRRVRLLVALTLAGAAVAGGHAAWAASVETVALTAGDAAPASAQAFRIATDLSIDGGPARHEESVVRASLHLPGLRDGEGRVCEADLMPRALADDTIEIRMALRCDGQPTANPRLLTRPGVPATVVIGSSDVHADGSFITTRGFRLTVKLDVI